jgi:hypothetical protein
MHIYVCIPSPLERSAAVCTVSAATTPYLIGESLAHFLGCVVDGFSSGVVAASGVLRDGLCVLCKRARAWVALAGPLSDSGARHRLP